jgi:transcriptional regulator with XRE-family HTH domain
MGVSEKIKILLLKRGMSQTELAALLGKSVQNFNNKLRNEKSFTVDELETIAKHLKAKYERTEKFTLADTGEEI